MKKIANIVFYKFLDENKEYRVQTAVYYNDGTTYSCTDEEGLKIAEKYLKEQTGIEPSREDIKKAKNIHFITGEKFEKDYEKYIVNETTTAMTVVETNEKDEILETYNNYKKAVELCEERVVLLNKIKNYAEDKDEEKYEDIERKLKINKNELGKIIKLLPNYIVNDLIRQYPELMKKKPKLDNEKTNKSKKTTNNNTSNSKKENQIVPSRSKSTNKKKKQGFFTRIKNKFKKTSSKETVSLNKEEIAKVEATTKQPKKEKQGFFTRIANKFNKKQKNKTKKMTKKGLKNAIISATLAVTMLFSCFGIAKAFANKKEDVNTNNGIRTERTIESGRNITDDQAISYNNNDYYNDYTYAQLLNVNTVQMQKTTMQNVGKALDGYNGTFAKEYQELDKDGNIIKPALTWDETMALTMAYNDHSKEDIQAIFNGSTINSVDFKNAYRMANLQLMGAHIIETKENPVDMSFLINTEEGKEFYEKYHTKYLELKDLSGKDLETKVNEFRNEIKKDFPITNDIREVGLSHSEPREIEEYQLSVIPMIGAFEMEYRNVGENEKTLNNKEIDYLNDTALCNLADEKFDIIQIVTYSTEENEAQPTYEQYKTAKIDELENANNYNVGDDERDPSKLSTFQDRVNAHYELKEGSFTGSVYYEDGSTYTKTKTTYRTETTRVEKEIPESEKEKIDQEIEKENEQAKEEAQKEADKKQEEIQKEADKETEDNINEVEKDDKDMQDKIDDANDKIENGDKVNEDDFGDHNVEFDDEHLNENGDLNDSVEDLTTNPTDDATNEPLPDPEETGKDFDGKVITQGGNGNTTKQNIFEYEETVNRIVENMANNPTAIDENPKQLVK